MTLAVSFSYSTFPPNPLCWVITNECWIMKCSFCIYWDDDFYSALCGRSHWLDVESSLHPWNKFHLITVNDPLHVFLNSVSCFVEDFCLYVHQGYWPVASFYCGIFAWFYWHTSDSPGGLAEALMWGFTLHILDSIEFEWSPILCISLKFPVMLMLLMWRQSENHWLEIIQFLPCSLGETDSTSLLSHKFYFVLLLPSSSPFCNYVLFSQHPL